MMKRIPAMIAWVDLTLVLCLLRDAEVGTNISQRTTVLPADTMMYISPWRSGVDIQRSREITYAENYSS